jgi:16S rRNA U1498 N3-methylase RsmE
MFVEPSASAGAIALRELVAMPPRATTILIGPEGGWTPEEIARGSAAGRLVTVGRLTLRADAMAIVTMTALLTHWRAL